MKINAGNPNVQDDLFPINSLPNWLPDEIFFSLASRYHFYSGNAKSSDSCLQLFANRHSGSQHDFPSCLDAFAQRSKFDLGSADEIIYGHTILNFYLPFKSKIIEKSCVDLMKGKGIKSMKFQLGILTSRFRANHPLKACIHCISADTVENGLPYWHLSHQYPGIWTCNRHGEPLYESTTKSTGVGRFLWYLPERKNLVLNAPLMDVSRDDELVLQLHQLTRLITSYIAFTREFFFAPSTLIDTYKIKLTALGYANRNGKLNFKRIATDFLKSLSLLIDSGLFPGLPSNQVKAESQLSRLLRPPRSGIHPLRHLLFILWLFSSWEEFWKSYQRPKTPRNIEGELHLSEPCRIDDGLLDPRKRNFIELIKVDQLSISKAAKLIGIDTSTGLAWATKFGINFKRRSKIIKGEIRAHLINDLKLGMEKCFLAKKYHVSIQLITTTLRTELALHETWSQARFENRRAIERTKLNTLVSEIGSLGAKVLRQSAPATYAWLYRNDREWLRMTLASVPKVSARNNSQVNWYERDLELSSKIEKVALELSKQGNHLIKLWEIYQLLPELKSKLGALDRLPLTNRTLQFTLKRNLKVTTDIANFKFND